MSKYCNKDCKEVGPVCDFCRLYNFNPGLGGVYTDRGYCVVKEQFMQPEDGCSEFICMNYKMLSDHERSRKIHFLDKKYEQECIRKQTRRGRKSSVANAKSRVRNMRKRNK